ncbi:MAG TPA: NHLP family bacteriocin export ABC transporter peptidase/permease/ATPase subunit [Ignavibacteriaceae bacterium]|nr:NHLP family bacteriocin export ABC transporter peptidase/permease/ATPase subunit [Ignavibacteriaceae bacterium]
MKRKRINTPTILQMEAAECGAASLAMVLAYFGKFIPLEALRLDCGISRNGSKASNIARAARKHGLEVKAYSKEPEDLKKMQLPLIVFWRFYHFIVVEGFSDEFIYVNDPASGKRKVPLAEFDRSFTGVVMTFSPGPDFVKGGVKNTFYSSLKKRLLPFLSPLLFLLLTGAALIIPNIIVPVISKMYIDEVWIKETTNWIIPLLGGLLLAAAVKGIFTFIQQNFLLKLKIGISAGTSGKFFSHLLKLPAEFYTQRSPNELGQRLIINDGTAEMLTGQLANTLLSLLMIVFYLLLMAYYDITLALITVVFSTLNFFALKYFSARRRDENQISMQERGMLYAFSTAGLQMIESIKARASESEFFSRWTGLHSRVINSQQKLVFLTQFLNLVPVFLNSLLSVIILIAGAVRIMQGEMTVGILVAVQSLAVSLMMPVSMLVNLGSTMQIIEGNLKRLDDVHNYPADPVNVYSDDSRTSDGKIKLDGYLELRNVTFGYERLERPLISDFSLTMKPGSRVAIVGKTGSGKSTISKLVGGLYKPWSGEILFDGMKRENIPPIVMQHSISLVDQDIFLFEGTIRDNITFWDTDIPEGEIIQAGKDADMHDDITSRPGGYDSKVSEGGKNFSGGQRQRIDIARALVNRPSILILDEATSALDAKTEKTIDDNIRKRGCTCIIIAHRLSTIRDCDEIIVLDGGKVVQRGTHDELKNVPGLYQKLIKE